MIQLLGSGVDVDIRGVGVCKEKKREEREEKGRKGKKREEREERKERKSDVMAY